MLTMIIVALIDHLHVSHGPDGISAWLNLPHVAAGLGFNWSGRCSGPDGFFQIQ
jgi:hypothetical protein